ncbi:MAG: FecR domain-containing protein [Sphingobacteriaceae bacterium]|nr:FecR domain-containing protein [Sphingobacteriaceae bacterium]
MDHNQLRALLQRYEKGECNPEEEALIERFYLSESANETLAKDPDGIEKDREKIWKNIAQATTPPKNKTKSFYIAVSVAASFIMILGYIFYSNPSPTVKTNVPEKNTTAYAHIVPGGNVAVLTLADGTKLGLDKSPLGKIALQDGAEISKTANGQLSYQLVSVPAVTDGQMASNVLSTPRGGQYQVVLSDGTKVWLNAASVLHFPARFTGQQRLVTLEGEAYFEVAKDRHKPFKVLSAGQTVEVLGTHFNINSYADEKSTRTTLLEGSVRIRAKSHNGQENMAILKPGEQATNAADLKVTQADVQETIAWKNNQFTFHSKPLSAIMRDISRWYNVDVEYKGNISEKSFTGSVSRYAEIAKVLETLELTNMVHFKVEERRIIAMP